MSTVVIKDGNGTVRHFDASGAGTVDDPFAMNQGSKTTGAQKPIFNQKLSTVGDGTGTTNMAVDGSGTPVVFRITPAAGEVMRVARWMMTIRDSGSMDSGGYGNNGGSPLTNGLLVEMVQDSTVVGVVPAVRSHIDIAALCYDITHHSWGSGDEFITARWSLNKSGQYVRLVGDDGDELRVTVRDDLTHLVEQVIYVQGYSE